MEKLIFKEIYYTKRALRPCVE